MKLRVLFIGALSLSITAGIIWVATKESPKHLSFQPVQKQESDEEEEAKFDIARAKYEYDMLKDPATGQIPKNIFALEHQFARTLPVRMADPVVDGSNSRTSILNNYIEAGPNNIGGRTRALAYDVRYNGGTNKVVIGGCVSGGIMRSTDGGSTWVRVTPENDIHTFTAIAQDPRPGSQDTWYAGGGEAFGNSASIPYAAAFLANGIWKSTDNGASWTKLTNTITDIGGGVLGGGTLEAFDNTFDLVHRLAVNPVNGNLYVAGHRRIVRSTDGGASFQVVFAGTVAANSENGQTDVAVSNTGKVYVAVNGGNPDPTIRGIWTSATGNGAVNNAGWTHIAGGQTLNVDSVAQWRGNDYSANASKRILIALAPSNQNLLYTFYENGQSSDDAKPEADLMRYDAGSNTWSNRSANMPDFPNISRPNVDPISIQGGYDMLLAIKPDNPDFVLIGGTNLYRSTDGFATTANTSWIGGYSPTYPSPGTYPNSHADIHSFAFNPSNSKQGICGNDGGVQLTDDVTIAGNSVAWSFPSKYQTLQYYYVAMDPEAGRNNFAGGAQDNGTTFRDGSRLFGDPTGGDPNNQISVFVNDGTSVGFAKFSNSPFQQVIYSGYQYGYIYRQKFAAVGSANDSIKPKGAVSFNADNADQFGEFVTVFKLNADNTEDLFYANFNKLFRTTSASTVNRDTWTEMTGVSTAISGTLGSNNIRALAFSRGPYAASHALYIGTTAGKIFRLDNPRNAAAATAPVNITPPTSLSWPSTGNVQDISVNPNNDDEIMAVVSNYGVVSIWWTNNAKAAVPTWKNAEGNLTLPSVRCCKIIVKKDASGNAVQEYYVGTSVGLYSVANLNTIMASNGTPTWQREGGNVLNEAVVVDMAYRPVDNTLLIGTHGNGMYYTTVGTPNFTANLNTGINDPVLNDKNFIKAVYPTIVNNSLQYTTGNMTGIRTITVELYNMKGQRIAQQVTAYQSGSVDVSRFAKGSYILTVTSNDNKYRHIQKLLKQ